MVCSRQKVQYPQLFRCVRTLVECLGDNQILISCPFFNCMRKLYSEMCYSSSKFLGPVHCDIDSEKKNALSKEQILLHVRHKHRLSS